MKNDKNDRFVRIAETRTNKIINMIRLLGNCANKSAYAYNEEQVRKIFNAIDKELKLTRSKFADSGENKFSL
jgi:ABC-type Fe3+-hydroxamate transport system substrate-binding protein